MTTSLCKLIALANVARPGSTKASGVLSPLYSLADGLTAWGGALTVRATDRVAGMASLTEWNSLPHWLNHYRVTQPPTWFAADVFGNQFGASEAGIVILDVECGELRPFAASLNEWAGRLLEEPRVHTGYPVLDEWTRTRGPVRLGDYLIAKRLFCLGGDFVVDNLTVVNERRMLDVLGPIAERLRRLPDGTWIRFGTEP